MKKNAFFKMLLFATVLCSNFLFADGSKDLYPANATGLRAYIRSSTSPTVNWPFPNEGVHYVYAKVGERITVASSAQLATTTSRIRLYAPDGTLVIDNNTIAGQIPDRAGELVGPQLFGGAVSGRYTPLYYLVPVTKAGLYRVELVARDTVDPDITFAATANWTQSSSNAGILAWDVSVINTANTGFIPGRVYANVLNLTNGIGTVASDGFYGKFYTLTKDGYTYRVNNNGNNGIYFTFFVNNNGFLDATTQNPIYKSLNGSTTAFLTNKVQDPNSADTTKNITHKMFYTLPSNDLPTSAPIVLKGTTIATTTWLKNAVVTPNVTNVSIVGVEGTTGQVSKKGGYIKFDADVQGNYTVTISGAGFATRTLNGSSSAGANQILWDGKDGSGNAPPVGTYPIQITVRLQGAEVHFPYIDMEYNRYGTIVELLNYTQLNLPTPVISVVSDIVYWNDTGVTGRTTGTAPSPIVNSQLGSAGPPIVPPSTGISSNTNGHIWGVSGSGTSGQFGDEKAIDTWTFIKAEEITISTSVIVKSADLMVSSITPDKTNTLEGDQIAYTVKVKNGGPSDVAGAPFLFKIPIGLSPQSIVFNGNGCGSESGVMSYNSGTQTYNSNLTLPSGCEITYIITVNVTNLVTAGNQTVEAAILRTNDVTDPDATNPNITIPPTNPYYECANNGIGGACNNIKNNNTVIVTLACYNDPAGGTGAATNHGITLLQRAGADNGNWPMIRKSAFTVLESNAKGFVITRMTTSQINGIVSPQDGMMVYDNDSHCLKIYTAEVLPAVSGWKCYNSRACP